MISFRVFIADSSGELLLDINHGDSIGNEIFSHIKNLYSTFKAKSAPNPKITFALEMGQFYVSLSACLKHYFMVVVSADDDEKIKQICRIAPLFLSTACIMHKNIYGNMNDPKLWIKVEPTLFDDIENEISSFYDPKITEYFAFICEGNIIYEKGRPSFANDEYFLAQSTMIDLSELCYGEKYATFESDTRIICFSLFKDVALGYINKEKLDDYDDVIDMIKDRITITKIIISRLFMVDNVEEEEDLKNL